jgi:hypothetical protein
VIKPQKVLDEAEAVMRRASQAQQFDAGQAANLHMAVGIARNSLRKPAGQPATDSLSVLVFLVTALRIWSMERVRQQRRA